MRRTGWLTILLINALVFSGLFFAGTEWFIAHKRATTLIYRPSARFHHELLANQFYARGAIRYRIGSEGLRGEVPKRGGLVVLGGSSAFDFRAEPSWPERLGPKLRARGIDLATYNGAIPGYSLREVRPFYQDRIRPHRPNAALIYVGWNDLKYVSASRTELTLPPASNDGPPPAQYDFLLAPRPLRNLRSLPIIWDKLMEGTDRVRENGAPLVMTKTKTSTASIAWEGTPGLIFFREQLIALIDELARDGVEPIIVAEITLASRDLPESERRRIALEWVRMSYPELLAANDAVAATSRQVARDRQVPFIDLRARLNGRSELFTDHVHLAPEGSEMFATRLADELSRTFRAARESRR